PLNDKTMDAINYIEFHEISNIETKLYYYISGGKVKSLNYSRLAKKKTNNYLCL
ncbi:unnamed protein product, partial [marine sediment metagenome]